MLRQHGEFILPDNVPANEFLNLEGNKISTSRNWAVWLHEYLEEFPGKEDVLRYTLCANAPETKDNDFTWKDFQAKNNNELVAILGNFVNRVTVLLQKYYEGSIPERGELFEIDNELVRYLSGAPSTIEKSLEGFKFREALANFIEIARSGNKYLAETEPWKLIKTNPERVKTIMNLATQVVSNMAVLGEPFLPFTVTKIQKMFNLNSLDWNKAGSIEILPGGHQINEPELLFEKIEDEVINAQVEKLKSMDELKNNEKEEVVELSAMKKEVTFDGFMSMDIRIGTILQAEKVEKSNKLLKFLVDTGVDKRTIVSGVAKHFSPEEVIGKQVTILLNLAPRKIMGIESQGMILLAEDNNKKLVFVTPEDKVTNGSGVS
jgi:methionyl-tRNA synthetase